MKIPLLRLITLFCSLLLAGLLLTLPLYKFDFRRFIKSRLFLKIMFWVPIFAVFVAVLYASNFVRLLLLIGILEAAGIEIFLAQKKYSTPLLLIYYALFILGFGHFILLAHQFTISFTDICIVIGIATVLADVGAFFFGNYLGRHKLPASLNRNKSWEGVLGEVMGALLGVLLLQAFVLKVPSLWIFLPLGIGSALGDLANSYVKRKLNITEWSHAIPGHGGFLDRFSSMAGSVTLVFYFLLAGF